jgi:vacuole morphology and inheritance protein 14
VSTANGTTSGQVINASPEDLANSQTLADPREPFNYAFTVNALTVQFMGEHEDTRIAALKWLIMLHQKNPKKVNDF